MAEIAAAQHGLISIEQLRRLGMEKDAARNRAAVGRLHRVHHGVYAVGHSALTPDAEFMAAALACGPLAALSHRSSGELWGVVPRRQDGIDVTAPGRRGRSPEGIKAHRHGSLRRLEVTSIRGIPCTDIPRTMLDLAGSVPVVVLRKAVEEAEVRRLLDKEATRALIKRSRGRRGVARLRMLLDELDPLLKFTRSELERRFLRLCRVAKLPSPEVNVPLDLGDVVFKPDFLWRQERLIVEGDSRTFHDTDTAFDSDRRREQQLQLAGWQVSRVTWAQIVREPRGVAATVAGLLALNAVDGPKSAHTDRF